MVQDRDGVGDVGNDLERATAASADERIRLKDLGDEPRPAWGAAALRGLLLLVLLASQFLGGPLAAYAVGVVGIEVGAMFAGVGDVVCQTRQPFQRVPWPRNCSRARYLCGCGRARPSGRRGRRAS